MAAAADDNDVKALHGRQIMMTFTRDSIAPGRTVGAARHAPASRAERHTGSRLLRQRNPPRADRGGLRPYLDASARLPPAPAAAPPRPVQACALSPPVSPAY